MSNENISCHPDVVEQITDSRKDVYLQLLKLLRSNPNAHFIADDLTQVTLMKAVRKAHMFRKDAKMSSWLHRIAVNVFIDDYRRNHRRVEKCTVFIGDLSDFQEPAAQIKEGPDHHQLKDLRRRLRRLNSEQQTMVLLHANGFSHQEMQDILKIPMGTLKSRLNRCYSMMRQTA